MNVLIIICASIASYRVFELITSLIKNGAKIDVILTTHAENFITKLSLSSMINGAIMSNDDFFSKTNSNITHIEITKDKDIVIVFASTANTMSKFANGIADNLALTTLLATKKPILFVPAMNPEMWNNTILQTNIKKIQELGYVYLLPPVYGETACGDIGVGHIAPLKDIITMIEGLTYNTNNMVPFNKGDAPSIYKQLENKKFLITNGPTKENIDSIRYISNYSSGKQGNAIVDVLLENGAIVFLVTTIYRKEEKNLKIFHVNTADEMLNVCISLIEKESFFVAICVAAICDWKSNKISKEKIKKKSLNTSNTISLELVQNPDILFNISTNTINRPEYVIGFSAETENLLENSKIKLIEKKCDMIVANQIYNNNQSSIGVGRDDNEVYIITNNKNIFVSKRSKYKIGIAVIHNIESIIHKGSF